MHKDKKILAIVLARGGSKGLPGKNIKVLNDKPLVCWTIDHIKSSKYVDDVYISTDSEKIAEVCRNYGIDVPELRPEKLAQDSTSSMDVIEYTIDLLESRQKKYDYIVLLEPTSPLRKKGDLDNIISLACDNPDRDGVLSVGEVHTEHPVIVKKINKDGCITPYLESKQSVYQRQQFDQAYYPYGVGYLIKTDILRKEHTFYTENILPYFVERWQNYEIDDIYDFICIENIMKMEMKNIYE